MQNGVQWYFVEYPILYEMNVRRRGASKLYYILSSIYMYSNIMHFPWPERQM